MSAHDELHAHADEHGHEELGIHATFKGYMTGFVLSVVLTVIPFWLVMGHVIAKSSTAAVIILALAAVQIVVHMIYFLHMNAKSEGGWNMLALVFTIVLVVITLSGSIWIMYHLNSNMMPHMMDTSNLP